VEAQKERDGREGKKKSKQKHAQYHPRSPRHSTNGKPPETRLQIRRPEATSSQPTALIPSSAISVHLGISHHHRSPPPRGKPLRGLPHFPDTEPLSLARSLSCRRLGSDLVSWAPPCGSGQVLGMSEAEAACGGGGGGKEQDRFLPIANIGRIMRRAVPENGKIAKDSKESIQECVSEFISFITSE